ncbi:DUF4236 domain-containing protein [Massilia sp.]|uniref:DUF4236 domain-containing protein n=1 Tax=Massilia sp. TaxID=1882437 RepID=UPI0039197288
MGLRFRKSFKLAPGVRLNVGSSGMSWSLGLVARQSALGSAVPISTPAFLVPGCLREPALMPLRPSPVARLNEKR